MSAASGDLLGVTCVFMPSGFPVAVVPPVPVPSVGGGRPARRISAPHPLPVSVDSRIIIVGAAQPVLGVGVMARSAIGFEGHADTAIMHIESSAEAAALCADSAVGLLRLTGDADPIFYNELEALVALGVIGG